MNEPILILGSPGSGASSIAGLLHHGCGVSMGDFVAPTLESPFGTFEAFGVVEAHRELLAQMERDATCPPTTFNPDLLDLTQLREQLTELRGSEGVWAIKDPATTFLLPAWAAVGVGPVRIVVVVRRPHDTIQSVADRYAIGEYWAEAVVDAYLRRLAELVRSTDAPVIEFSNDGDSVLAQTGDLADRLGLDWDRPAAARHFDGSLVRHQSPHAESSPAFDELIAVRHGEPPRPIRATDLSTLNASSAPAWPLATHVGGRYQGQRSELWRIARFDSVQRPRVTEIVPVGAPQLDALPQGFGEVDRVEIASAQTVGIELLQKGVRPDAVIAHGVLADHPVQDVAYFLRSVQVMTSPFAQLVVDIPAPSGTATAVLEPSPPSEPTLSDVTRLAVDCGWEPVHDERLSPGRVGLVLRKRIAVDDELQPLRTEIALLGESLATIGRRLENPESAPAAAPSVPNASATELDAARRRAETAERDLRRLRGRRSVRFALAVAQPFGGLFRSIRTRRSGGDR